MLGFFMTKAEYEPEIRAGSERKVPCKDVWGTRREPQEFVARGYAREIDHLSDLFVEALRFKGFSYVDVIQPCITWGTHPVSWYKERIYQLPPEYNPHNREEALKRAAEGDDRIPIGIFYHDERPQKLFGDHFKAKIYDGKLTELGFPSQQTIAELIERFRTYKVEQSRGKR